MNGLMSHPENIRDDSSRKEDQDEVRVIEGSKFWPSFVYVKLLKILMDYSGFLLSAGRGCCCLLCCSSSERLSRE